MANWARKGKEWFPIAMLAADYRGPVLFADETALDHENPTVTWFSADADRTPIKHREHARDEKDGSVKFGKDANDQEHVIWTDEREIAPAFWSPAVVSG